MSKELKELIADYNSGTQDWDDTCRMFCKISKRKDLQRQLKHLGPKSYNKTHVRRAIKKFLLVNPEYGELKPGSIKSKVLGESSGSGSVSGSGANETGSGNGAVNGSGSGLLEIADHSSGSGSVCITVQATEIKGDHNESVDFNSVESKKGSGSGNGSPVSADVPATVPKKEYPEGDIIVRIKKRLADVSNERSILQGKIEKTGTGNDAESISARKGFLDAIKALGDEYDRLFNAKEKYFKDNILPEETIFSNDGEPKKITVVEAVGIRNNIRSQISRAKKKSEKLTGDDLAKNGKKIENLTIEVDRLQAIIDHADTTE